MKLEAGTDRRLWRRIDPDLEFLSQNIGFAARPGPHENISDEIEGQLRQAVLSQQEIVLHYRPRQQDRTTKPLVQPYGFLIGKRHYLVAFCLQKSARNFRLYALSGIDQVDQMDRHFVRDEDFKLETFAANSFGVFQGDETLDVKLRFSADVTKDASRFAFHPSQKFEQMENGELEVSFRCCGITELCWHLFTWGSSVKIIGPDALKVRYQEILKDAAISALD